MGKTNTKGIKTYDETLDFLYSQLPMFQNTGVISSKIDLRKIIALCNWLDNPQKKFRTIHIAGTNGKGSISHLLAAILSLHGLKVGLYTSPHYKDFRERIKIDGKLVSKSLVTRFVQKFENDYQDKINPSFFELTVAMAFEAFSQEQVDIAIIETGLGGKLDSTNVINPELSIISNISFDHQAFLGNTLKSIAKSKAGIIKKNTPVLIGEYQKEVWDVFAKEAKKQNAKIHKADRLVKLEPNSTSVNVTRRLNNYKLKFDWLAQYQLQNLKTSLAASHLLDNILKDFDFDEKKIKTSLPAQLKFWKYMGRMQVLQNKPKVIIDSAHNVAGIKEWRKMIDAQKFKQLHIVLGVVKDKDLSKILSYLPTDAKYYFVQAKIPRALNKEILQEAAVGFKLFGKTYKSVGNGLGAAKRSAAKNDLITVIGSIFVLAEIV